MSTPSTSATRIRAWSMSRLLITASVASGRSLRISASDLMSGSGIQMSARTTSNCDSRTRARAVT